MPLPLWSDGKLMLAILRELSAAGGQARPEQLYASLRQYFPEITDEDLVSAHASGDAKWPNTVRWARQHLVNRGFIDASVRGTWAITTSGTEWMNRHWMGPSAGYSGLKLPLVPPVKAGQPGAVQPGPPVAGPPEVLQPGGWLPPRLIPQTLGLSNGNEDILQVRRVPARHRVAHADSPLPPAEPASSGENSPEESGHHSPKLEPTETLIQRLQAGQRLSGQSRQFELDIAAAFEVLGFSCRHIGGSGATDILLSAPLVQSAYTVVVDAKTSQSGRVAQGRIDVAVIGNHRRDLAADYAAVVGEDFSAGQLQRFAEQFELTLITTTQLAELVRLHARSPFSLIELRELFVAAGRADAGMAALREFHRQHWRRWRLLAELIDVVNSSIEFALEVRTMLVLLTQRMKARGDSAPDLPTLQDVIDAVGFLSSRPLAVLIEVPDSGGAYQLTMSVDTAHRRLLALGHAVDKNANGRLHPLPLQVARKITR
jgi:hypothetical protein